MSVKLADYEQDIKHAILERAERKWQNNLISYEEFTIIFKAHEEEFSLSSFMDRLSKESHEFYEEINKLTGIAN